MTTRLSILPYLQSWDGTGLQVRLLLLPRGSPLDPLAAGSPSFAAAKFTFDIRLIPGLDVMPTLGGPPGTIVAQPVVATSQPLFGELQRQFQIDPAPPAANPRRAGTQIKKHLPATYQDAAQYSGGRTPLVFTDDTYECAIASPPPKPFRKLPPPDPRVPWGKVLAALMRQPVLAEGAGLVRRLSVVVTPQSLLVAGGWLYVTLANTSDGATLLGMPDALKIYATRIPALGKSGRELFTPVLFPVTQVSPAGSYDEQFAEVDNYDDGFAKIIHCAQPQQLNPLTERPDGTRPVRELGVRLGWDDEQVTIWLNRQIDPIAASLDAPMGVFGYRVDARLPGKPKWHSLCRAQGPVKVGAIDLGQFNGELGVETHPVQFEGQKTGDYWLPTYFTNWTGASLVTLDTDTILLAGGPDKKDPGRVQGIAPDLALRYGQEYEFRVRLMDHTGGGPALEGEPLVPGPSPIATLPFRRWIRPQRLRLQAPPPATPDPTAPPATLTLHRPLLGHPAVVHTGAYTDPLASLRADLPAAKTEKRDVGLPDPDVAAVRIVVTAQGLAQDPLVSEGYQMLYETTRAFPNDPAQPLSINLAWVDVHNATALIGPAAGPLPLPTARNVRLQLYPLGRDDPQLKYFGADDVRTGPPITVNLRKHSSDERNLFAPDLPTHRFSALFLQPDPVVDATVLFAQRAAGSGGQRPSDVPSRLAAQLDLRHDGLTLRARPGRRVVFGCAPSLRHVIGPDNASITFASQSDLVKHWLVVVRLTLDRDWMWDGLAHDGIVVERDGQVVGRFGPTRNVGTDALVNPERSQSDICFFDGVDPKPPSGAFPAELILTYTIRAEFVSAPQKDNPLTLKIRLPVTTAPAQRPQIVSAGIAMSAYIRSTDYSSTEPRRRALWLEFDRPPDDQVHDRYFARMLRNAPDHLLSAFGESLPEIAEPPLAVDPEWIRVIVQDQADDQAGLAAMQELTPSDSPVHFAVPLPPGLTEESSALFGFFTYELRVGHKTEWTTAQGRFGPPLRVTGVQHPAPALSCAVVRNRQGITVSAPFAVPILNGRSVQADKPRSQIWVQLYAQAEQVDGQDRRNVLLGRKPAPWTGGGFSGGGKTEAFGTATFADAEIRLTLEALAFADDAQLSVLAVELLPNGTTVVDPLGVDLGAQRILRTSPLTPVPAIC